jgi:hypothetical protein
MNSGDAVCVHQPRCLAVLGVTAYRIAWNQPRATLGLQDLPLGTTKSPLGESVRRVAPIVVESARRDFSAQCRLPADEFYADSFLTEADKAATA